MIKLVGGKDIPDREEKQHNAPARAEMLPNGIMQDMETKLVTRMTYDVRVALVDDEFLKKKREKELENRMKL